jgi:glycosyltransferase involved in cell wall biosynthesis
VATETISVIILTYNRKRLLKGCLDSLLWQSVPGDEVELLVADDGSDDGTDELVARYRAVHPNIKYLHHPHQGISATRNLGIRAATGEFIAIVADDYILDRDYLKVILEFFRAHPEARVVRFRIVASRNDFGSRVSHFYYDASMRGRLHNRRFENPKGLLRGMRSGLHKPAAEAEPITVQRGVEASGAAAFRRNVFDQVGLFDENLARGEDTDLTLRLHNHNIEVYYNPQLQIQHQYERLMLDTIRKCFESGWSRYYFYRKHCVAPYEMDRRWKTRVSAKFGTLLNALRHLETPRQFLIYGPFLVFFEIANKAGFLCAVLDSKLRPANSKT